MNSKSFTALLLAIVSHGCDSSSNQDRSDAPSPTATEVTVAVPAGYDITTDWELAVSEWEAATSANVEFHEYQSAADPVPIPPEADLLIAPLSSIGQLVDDGWPGTIPDSVAETEWRDLLSGARDLSMCGGQPKFLPLDCPLLAVYYRADLLKAAGLSPPATWAEYDRLVESLGDWAPGLTAVEPQSDASQCTLFLSRVAGYALHPDNYSLVLNVENGKPLIGEPPFVQALEQAAALQPFLDPQSLNMAPDDCYRAVLDGRAAIGIGFPAEDVDRAEGVALGVCRLPGAERIYHQTTGEWQEASDGGHVVTVVGAAGFTACVAATTEAPEVDWHLLSAINDQTGGLTRRLGFRGVCGAAALPDAISSPPRELQSAEWQAIVETHSATLNETRVVHDLPLPDRTRFEQSLLQAIRSVQDGSANSDAALAGAADEWTALIEELGRRRVVNVYRQCAGLSPYPEGFALP